MSALVQRDLKQDCCTTLQALGSERDFAPIFVKARARSIFALLSFPPCVQTESTHITRHVFRSPARSTYAPLYEVATFIARHSRTSRIHCEAERQAEDDVASVVCGRWNLTWIESVTRS